MYPPSSITRLNALEAALYFAHHFGITDSMLYHQYQLDTRTSKKIKNTHGQLHSNIALSFNKILRALADKQEQLRNTQYEEMGFEMDEAMRDLLLIEHRIAPLWEREYLDAIKIYGYYPARKLSYWSDLLRATFEE